MFKKYAVKMCFKYKKKLDKTENTVKSVTNTTSVQKNTVVHSSYSQRTENRSVSSSASAISSLYSNGPKASGSTSNLHNPFQREFEGSKSKTQIVTIMRQPPISATNGISRPLTKPNASTQNPVTPSTTYTSRPVQAALRNPVVESFENLAIKSGLMSLPQGKLQPGVAYIFNHETFDNQKMKEETRIGTKEDVKALNETLGDKFKMSINIFNDLRLRDIKAQVGRIQQQDFTRKSCIVIVILTHGTRHDVVCAKDGQYSIDDDILFPMLQNKTLANKPKVFIIQACKGDYATETYVLTDAKPNRLNTPSQIAKLYSTFEGFVSYRGKSGSLFIQILCDNLQKYGFTATLMEIMQKTIERIEKEYDSRQVPTIMSNMTIPLTFGDYA